jgi:hypothetical protein
MTKTPTDEERSRLLAFAQAASQDIAQQVGKFGGAANVLVLIGILPNSEIEVRFVGRSDAERVYASDAMITRLLQQPPSASMVPVVVLDRTNQRGTTATGHILVGASKGGDA